MLEATGDTSVPNRHQLALLFNTRSKCITKTSVPSACHMPNSFLTVTPKSKRPKASPAWSLARASASPRTPSPHMNSHHQTSATDIFLQPPFNLCWPHSRRHGQAEGGQSRSLALLHPAKPTQLSNLRLFWSLHIPRPLLKATLALSTHICSL